MAKNKFALRNEDLKKVVGGKKQRHRHTHHIETRAFLNRLFNRRSGEDVLGCENPKHRQFNG